MPASDEWRASWDPRYQPCVPVVSLKGEAVDLSLVEVFRWADRLSIISCATPGEGCALIEYLLALCFASKTFPSSDPEWVAWVTQERTLDNVADWLADQSAADWDLFHPEQPLGQNSKLRQQFDEDGVGPSQLVLEQVGDYVQLFDRHHLEHSDNRIPAAVAFRAMLTQHVYGLAGRARISGKTLGSKLTNLSAGRLQGRIRVVVQGRTVGDTLRLNLYPLRAEKQGTSTSRGPPGGINRAGDSRQSHPAVPRPVPLTCTAISVAPYCCARPRLRRASPSSLTGC